MLIRSQVCSLSVTNIKPCMEIAGSMKSTHRVVKAFVHHL
jgi:hypothetical protein